MIAFVVGVVAAVDAGVAGDETRHPAGDRHTSEPDWRVMMRRVLGHAAAEEARHRRRRGVRHGRRAAASSPTRSATSATRCGSARCSPRSTSSSRSSRRGRKLERLWPKVTAAADAGGRVVGRLAEEDQRGRRPTSPRTCCARCSCRRAGWTTRSARSTRRWSGLRFVLRKELRRPGDKRRR